MIHSKDHHFRVLVADDEPSLLEIFADALEVQAFQEPEKGGTPAKERIKISGSVPVFEITQCHQSEQAVEQIQLALQENNPYAIAFLDVRMPPGKDGYWAAKEIRKIDSEIELVVMTGFPEIDTEETIAAIQPTHKILYVRKPLSPQEIFHFCNALSEKWKTEKKFKALKSELENQVVERGKQLESLSQEIQHDSVERQKTKEDLEKIRQAMNLSGEGILIIDIETGKFLEVNQKSCEQLGYEYEELMDLTIMDVEVSLPNLEAFHDRLKVLQESKEKVGSVEGMHRHKGGFIFPVEVNGKLQKVGNKSFLFTSVKDISAWKRITEELSASKTHLSLAQQISSLGSWELNLATNEYIWSDENYRIYEQEKSKASLKLDAVAKKMSPEDFQLFLEILEKSTTDKSNFEFEHQLIISPERKKTIRLRWQVFCDENDKPVRVVGTTLDVTQQRLDQQEKQRLRELLDSIIDSMPSILIGVDEKGQVTHWNKQAQLFTGVSALKAESRSLYNVFPDLSLAKEMITDSINKHETIEQSRVSIAKDNKDCLFDIKVYPLAKGSAKGAVIMIEDVTKKVRVEEIMMQTEKMFTIGGLAAGMAHEINTPLAGIIQNLQIVKNRLTEKSTKNIAIAQECGTSIEQIEGYLKTRKLDEVIDRIHAAGERAARIVKNMLNFSYKAGTVYSKHSLSDLLDKTLELAQNEYNLKKNFDFKKISIIKEYDNDIPKVPCEGNTIQQVFFNILKNGAHAMHKAANNAKACFYLRVMKEDKFIRVEIEDNGPGIDDQVLSKIFEPFYTTKEYGEGTGLGLAVSYFIITENHGGTIGVESPPGKGAKFIIRLPL